MGFVLLFALVLSGCAGTGSGDGDASSGLNYYYDEFKDVAIPKEMSPEKKETFITYTADGVKLGTQIVSGRVEMASLVTAMQGYMQRDGWTLRSVFRSTRSILIFEREDRMCSIYIGDGMMTTTMLIFVSPKISDGALQYSAPVSSSTEAFAPSDPPISSSGGSYSDSNVTVYPAQ